MRFWIVLELSKARRANAERTNVKIDLSFSGHAVEGPRLQLGVGTRLLARGPEAWQAGRVIRILPFIGSLEIINDESANPERIKFE